MTDPSTLPTPPLTTLQTPRLTLRTALPSDLPSLLPIITDPATMEFTSGVVPKGDLARAEKWVSARVLGEGVFNFVVLKRKEDGGEGELVGIMGSYAWPEVGYLVHPGKLLVFFILVLVSVLFISLKRGDPRSVPGFPFFSSPPFIPFQLQ